MPWIKHRNSKSAYLKPPRAYLTSVPEKEEARTPGAPQRLTFAFGFSQDGASLPRLLVEAWAAPVTAVTARVVFALAAGFLVKTGEKHTFSSL